MEDPAHASRSSPRAPGAGGGSAARHRTVRYEWDGSPSPTGSPQRTPHDEMLSRASSPGKGWRDAKLTIATPPSPSSKPATRPTTPHDSPRKSPGPPSFRRTPSGRAVSWTEDDLRGWFEQKLESFAEQASAARAEMDARQLAQQRTLEELLARLEGGGGVEGGAPSTDSVEAMRALADELWAGETGWHAASKQVGSQADSRKRMELHSALQLLQQVEREREEMRLRWFGGGGEAVNPLQGGARAWREGEGKEPWRQQDSVSSSWEGRRAAAAQGGVVWVPDGPLDADGAAPSGGIGAASRGGACEYGEAPWHGGAAKRQYEASLEESGLPEPWSLVERLADEVLEDVLQELLTPLAERNCAESMYVACNEAVEMVAEAEFAREA
ncbi:hypothetical protein AB1Y20_004091 [Prymnesium parvum]|uniref:DUF4378 domain-containing protein n=1 Tax=Prymnesium parvum TaxID=97485 RepID=A0AB34J6M9_PRYPA